MPANWTTAKPATDAMLKQAKAANDQVSKLKDDRKKKWSAIAAEVKKAFDASTRLDDIAKEAKDEKEADARRELAAAVQAAGEAVKLIDAELKKLPESEDEKATDAEKEEREILETLARALKMVSGSKREAVAKALGPPSAETVTKPEPKPAPPDAQGTKTPAEKAVAAAAEALKQAVDAETETNKIEKADTLETVKAAVANALQAATKAKDQAAVAKEQAGAAMAGVTEAEKKKLWEAAANAAKTAGDDAAALGTAATAVAGKTTADEIKKAAKDSKLVSLAGTAKGSATAAKTKADNAKAGKEDEKKEGEKKEEKKQVPNTFGMSITAAYSRKFSLDTTVHSKIEVTMVPYPPPQQFLDWVRANYEKAKPR